MAKERVVSTKFWDDSYIIGLDPIEKLIFLYLLTNPLTNISGIYEISIKRIGFDTGIDRDMVIKIFDRFETSKKIIYRDGWVIIVNFIKNQKNNPSVQEGIKREIASLPSNIIDLLQTVTDWGESGLLNLTKLNLTKLNLTESDKKTDPRIKKLIDYHHDLFLKKFNNKPTENYSKSGKLLKTALETYDEEILKTLLNRFFVSKDEWICKSGYGLGVFYSQINKLLTGNQGEAKNQLERLIEMGGNVD
jgi:hypothetical protein